MARSAAVISRLAVPSRKYTHVCTTTPTIMGRMVPLQQRSILSFNAAYFGRSYNTTSLALK